MTYTFKIEDNEEFGRRSYTVINVELARTLARFTHFEVAEHYIRWLGTPAQDRGDWDAYLSACKAESEAA